MVYLDIQEKTFVNNLLEHKNEIVNIYYEKRDENDRLVVDAATNSRLVTVTRSTKYHCAYLILESDTGREHINLSKVVYVELKNNKVLYTNGEFETIV